MNIIIAFALAVVSLAVVELALHGVYRVVCWVNKKRIERWLEAHR